MLYIVVLLLHFLVNLNIFSFPDSKRFGHIIEGRNFSASPQEKNSTWFILKQPVVVGFVCHCGPKYSDQVY